MIRIVLAITIPLVLVGCGPKSQAPSAAAAREPIPETWSGVSFDDDVSSLSDEVQVADPTTECSNLLRLEPAAMMGQLTDAQITCLDRALRLSPRQTDKDHISRVLMADAWAKKDMHRWEGAVRRHLEEIDRSDPDMAYVFSLHLAKGGVPEAFEAIRYAEVALDNKSAWGPEEHAEKVSKLLKARAKCAEKLWLYYENRLLTDKNPENTSQAERWRAQTKSMAREWLQWAHNAGEDVEAAFHMCVSAAGTMNYCQIGFGDDEEGTDAPAPADAEPAPDAPGAG